MPVVRIEMYDGRSIEEKRQLVREVTDVVARVTGNTPQGVHVIIEASPQKGPAMLTWHGRDIPETLPEIVDPAHTVVIMHDIQNDNTGPDGVFAKAGRRIDVANLVGPIAGFLDTAREHRVRVMYTQYTNLPGVA
ncbi:MAG: tautomerase family protein, partial [Candidatus Rokuibacteriota bacterium]